MVNNRVKISDVFLHWLPMAFIATMFCFVVYAVNLQEVRQAANDPQIEMSETISRQIAQGVDPAEIVFQNNQDISDTISPFVLVYDESKNLVAFTTTLFGGEPNIPPEMLESAQRKGEHRSTWEPSSKVHTALVSTYFSGKQTGYVVVGRSMREAEKQINSIFMITFSTWLISLGGSLALVLISRKLHEMLVYKDHTP